MELKIKSMAVTRHDPPAERTRGSTRTIFWQPIAQLLRRPQRSAPQGRFTEQEPSIRASILSSLMHRIVCRARPFAVPIRRFC